jgi:hypothetical protein
LIVKRKLIPVLLAMLLVISSTMAVSAIGNDLDDEIIISPMFTYIFRAEAQIYINSSGKATAITDVFGNKSVTSTRAIVRLQQLRDEGWVTIRSWTETSNTRFLNFAGTYNVPKGYYYRVQSTVTAYSGSQSETTTLTTSYQKY